MVTNAFLPTSTALSHSHPEINGRRVLYRKRNSWATRHGRGRMRHGSRIKRRPACAGRLPLTSVNKEWAGVASYFAYWLVVTRMSVLSELLAMCAPLPVLPPTRPVNETYGVEEVFTPCMRVWLFLKTFPLVW